MIKAASGAPTPGSASSRPARRARPYLLPVSRHPGRASCDLARRAGLALDCPARDQRVKTAWRRPEGRLRRILTRWPLPWKPAPARTTATNRRHMIRGLGEAQIKAAEMYSSVLSSHHAAARQPGRRWRGCCGIAGWVSPRTCSRSVRVRSYDNALAESSVGLFKTELNRSPRHTGRNGSP